MCLRHGHVFQRLVAVVQDRQRCVPYYSVCLSPLGWQPSMQLCWPPIGSQCLDASAMIMAAWNLARQPFNDLERGLLQADLDGDDGTANCAAAAAAQEVRLALWL